MNKNVVSVLLISNGKVAVLQMQCPSIHCDAVNTQRTTLIWWTLWRGFRYSAVGSEVLTASSGYSEP
jgi:hypothetical protein